MADTNFDNANAIDLGCGTGILSFLLCQRGVKRIFAVDNIENAVIATQTNSQALGYNDKIKSMYLDVVENYNVNKKVVYDEDNKSENVKMNKGIKQIVKQQNYDQVLTNLKYLLIKLELIQCLI